MSIRKLISVISLALTLATPALAGTEDWTGEFTILSPSGEKVSISHTPTHIELLYMTIGGCMHFGKGSRFNSFTFNNDVNFCRTDNVDTFTANVTKMGVIVNRTVSLGPTYTV